MLTRQRISENRSDATNDIQFNNRKLSGVDAQICVHESAIEDLQATLKEEMRIRNMKDKALSVAGLLEDKIPQKEIQKEIDQIDLRLERTQGAIQFNANEIEALNQERVMIRLKISALEKQRKIAEELEALYQASNA